MTFNELAWERFSVRSYKAQPIEPEKEAKILEMAQAAPTACNNQPQKIYVLKSKEALEKINQVCRCIFGAPEVLVVAYDKNIVWNNPVQEGYNTGEVDASIVTTHLMLAAWEQGIASCWVRFFNADEVRQAIGIPENEEPVALLPIGYAAEDATPSPKHTQTRPLTEMVHEL